jgi:hypothetical protein
MIGIQMGFPQNCMSYERTGRLIIVIPGGGRNKVILAGRKDLATFTGLQELRYRIWRLKNVTEIRHIGPISPIF